MGKRVLNYAELKEAYYNLYNEKLDAINLKNENEKLKERIKKLEKQVIELSCLVKVSK